MYLIIFHNPQFGQTTIGAYDPIKLIWRDKRDIDFGYHMSEELLVEIEKLLKSSHISKSALSGVLVYPGPGPYTSVRICVSTANAIGCSLNIPVVGIKDINKIDIIKTNKFSAPVAPKYLKSPTITKPRSR